MTDHEKDREAVEWLKTEMRWADMNDLEEHAMNCRRVLALAREALAMRERGPVWWTVRHKDGTYLDYMWDRPEYVECEEGDAIVPLYAGEPVEVEE